MDNKDIFNFSETRLKVDSLQQRVYERIKKLILTNRLRPGQSISIDQLASELGVSHTPVREALAMLKLDGLVMTGYHKTPQVTDIDDLDVREIYDVRKMLEGFAIRQVCNKLSDEDIRTLEGLVDTYLNHQNEDTMQERLAQSDVSFHGLIVSKVENNTFFRLYRMIEDMALRIRTLVITQSAEKIDVISKEHFAVLDALRRRDTEEAYQQLMVHLDNARERTLKAIAVIEENENGESQDKIIPGEAL
jgi:DNA-binding GntR family transcriptional regulator